MFRSSHFYAATAGRIARTAARLEVADFTAVLGDRSLELMAEYRDAEMDFADASLVALAEMRRDYRIVTFDGDFRFYRRAGRLSFAIINGSA